MAPPAAAQEFGSPVSIIETLGPEHNYGPPQLTTDGAGNWVAVFDSIPSFIFTVHSVFTRSTDNSASWTTPAFLSTSSNPIDLQAHVATDAAGNWLAVWGSYFNDVSALDIRQTRSTDGGATWSTPTLLNTNAATDSVSDEQPRIATDGMGTWVTVWAAVDRLNVPPTAGEGILVARSTDVGVTWTAPAVLAGNTPGSGDQIGPQLTTDGSGTWVVAWESGDPLGTDRDILFARSTDGGVTWSAPAALNTNAASDTGDDTTPQLSVSDGTWLAAWSSTDTLGATLGSDADVLFATSTDAGVTWTAPAALATNAATDSGDDTLPRVRPDGAGSWLAIWQSDDSLSGSIGTDFDILKSRSDDDGASWSAPGALHPGAETDILQDTAPDAARNAAGDWIAIWHRNGIVAAATNPGVIPMAPSLEAPGIALLAALLLGLGALHRRARLG